MAAYPVYVLAAAHETAVAVQPLFPAAAAAAVLQQPDLTNLSRELHEKVAGKLPICIPFESKLATLNPRRGRKGAGGSFFARGAPHCLELDTDNVKVVIAYMRPGIRYEFRSLRRRGRLHFYDVLEV